VSGPPQVSSKKLGCARDPVFLTFTFRFLSGTAIQIRVRSLSSRVLSVLFLMTVTTNGLLGCSSVTRVVTYKVANSNTFLISGYEHECNDFTLEIWSPDIAHEHLAVGPPLVPVLPIVGDAPSMKSSVNGVPITVKLKPKTRERSQVPWKGDIYVVLPTDNRRVDPASRTVWPISANPVGTTHGAFHFFSFQIDWQSVPTFTLYFEHPIEECTIPPQKFEIRDRNVYLPLHLPR
jgi:hypothetical protein